MGLIIIGAVIAILTALVAEQFYYYFKALSKDISKMKRDNSIMRTFVHSIKETNDEAKVIIAKINEELK